MKYIREEEALRLDKGNGSSLAEFIGRAAAIRRDGYGVAKTKLAAGAREEKHRHSVTEEVYLFIRGDCRMRVNGEEYRLSGGDLLLAEPGDEHEITEAVEETEFWVLTVPAFEADDYLTNE